MGHMNSAEVVCNTESGEELFNAVELQPRNSGTFVFVSIFAMLFYTILNWFYLNGLPLMRGLLISVCDQNHFDWDRIYYFDVSKLVLESFGDISISGFVHAWGTGHFKEIKNIFYHLCSTI